MNQENILIEKRDNLLKTLNREPHKYVPSLAFPGPATAAWSGTTALESTKDVESYVKALNGVFGEMWVDCTIDHGITTLPVIEQTFGNVQYKIGPDGTTVEHLQCSPMKDDEYDQLIADPEKFVKGVLVPRKFPFLFNSDIETAKNAIKTLIDAQGRIFFELGGALMESMEKDYNIVLLTNTEIFPQNPLDTLFDSFRGFKGTLTDLRRRSEQVEAACESLWTYRCGLDNDEPMDSFPLGEQMPHMPAYLSAKQFEKLYWPYQMKFYSRFEKNSSKLVTLLEGSWKHVVDFYNDAPKDVCVLMSDDDDVRDVMKAVGKNQIVSGGAKLAQIRLASKEENIEYTKQVLDECAPCGGFIFGTDKNWISPGDVNQNLIDVYNFVHEYGRY